MKLVLVTETYPPEINGVAMTLERLVRNLIKQGHDVEVVRPRQKVDDGTTLPYPVHLMRGVPIPGYAGLQFGWFSGGQLKKLWSKKRPDVIHIATEGMLGFSALNVARKLGIPVVTSFHTNFHSYGDHYNYKFLANGLMAYFRWFHNRTLATFVPSQQTVDDLEEFGFKNVKIFSRGVDTELFGRHRRSEALRQSWGVENGDPVVVYVGRVAAEKNIPLTIATWQRLQKHLPKTKLVVVGDGPARAALEKKHPEIIFAGMRRGEELAAHYASGEFFFFASTTETFGNVLTEAMASELVVLGYDYAAANHHVVDEENGFKASFKDEAAFLDSVDRIVGAQADWPAIRQSARTKAESLSWASIIREYATEVARLAKQDQGQ